MNLVISGYGRMGREIEKAAQERGHRVTAIVDTPADWKKYDDTIRQADMVIEFSTPASALENIRTCFDLHLPVVVGTTGWHEHASRVRKWCDEESQSFFTASNFSIGVNILHDLTRQLSGFIDRFEEYSITLEEIHHIHKLDSPSGTAISLAGLILDGVERKKKWVNRKANSTEELEIRSVRQDEITGIHTICCESDSDRLILRHEAKNRRGFAAGALLAAEWLAGRKGYFDMKDLLNITA